MDIHGISFDVYTWYICGISWYIHGYSELSETRFRRRPVLLRLVSFNLHTRVSDQECFIPRATIAIAPGEKAAHKRLSPTAANVPRLSLVAAVTAAAAAVSRAAFRFPSLLAGNDLNLGEGFKSLPAKRLGKRGRGCLQDR
jgi:hypothetical protein